MGTLRRRWMPAVALSAVLAACSSSTAAPSTTPPPATTSTTPPATTSVAPVATDAPASTSSTAAPTTSVTAPTTTAVTVSTADPTACTALHGAVCGLLPWPNDAWTVADPTTPTRKRLALPAEPLPENASGVPIDVSDQNRADGFSPGTAVLVDAPGVDVAASKLPPSTDIGASVAAGTPITITDVQTDERWPYWAEVDAQTPSSGLLMLHPAKAFTEGHTYAVHIEAVVDAQGTPVTPAVRNWLFTIASAQSLAGRLLTIRADAYKSLGDVPPVVAITTVDDTDGVRTIEGTVDVPNYLTGDGSPGNRFALGADGLPVHNTDHPVIHAPFRCLLPLNPAAPVPVIVYGHGLLGNRAEVDGLSFAAKAGIAAACATDEIGMSSDDIANLATILGDMSHFPEQADRMQQGLLDVQFLARAINDERALATTSPFADDNGNPIIAPGQTVFVGNSQGGILGGAASAISTEWSRAVLGVPGMDYALLLHRSSDWPEFAAVYDKAYPDPMARVLGLQLAQLLWDRGENDGYAQHLTADPYDGIAAKDVLLIEAFGDHQVTNLATEMLARTIGAKVHQPALADGRSKDVTPMWGIEPLTSTKGDGGALVMWDYGTPAPPTVNLPPTEPEYGKDPHGAGSREPKVLQQALTFLLQGTVDTNSCDGPCTSTVLSGG